MSMKKKVKNRVVALIACAAAVLAGTTAYNVFHTDKSVTLGSGQFVYENVPEYNGESAYYTVNDDVPYFTEDEITTDPYVNFGALDSLGRCTASMGCISSETMPPEDETRGNISSVKPTGWNNVQYDCIEDGYCQNRAHCIAWCLCGANAEKRNLVTGSPYMNDTMAVYEVKTARYIEQTGNHVMYRVTPVFVGDELMCRGVLMEAYSVEDNGEGLHFNIYAYNVQPGISYDYATGESHYTGEYLDLAGSSSSDSDGSSGTSDDGADEGSESGGDYSYILNTNSMKMHKSDCSNAESMSSKNKQYSNEDRQTLIDHGYTPAGCCNP